ncbi:MAG TPA: dephospho-CoA kinase [Gammaproteobacteria bacterium]|nr:dephospho-CoA kinase [Gammaproteobacteria bacterium]
MTLRIGLTGGIASGKSAAAAEFARLGVPVIDADEAAREVTAPGSPALSQIAALRPEEPLAVNGALDRKRLRALLFADPVLRRDVEAILHPRIIAHMKTAIAAVHAPYVILAIPLLAEAGGASELVDRVLVIDCPEELQVERLMRRDGETEAGARLILAAQANREARLKLADDVIENSASLDRLNAAVAQMHARYRRMAESEI